MSILSDSVSELGMDIRNQHETVKIPLVDVRLLLGSLILMLELAVNVAEKSCGLKAKK